MSARSSLRARGRRAAVAAPARGSRRARSTGAGCSPRYRIGRRSPSTSSASGSRRSRATTSTALAAGRPHRGAGQQHADRAPFLVAHDMGTSVATELLARDLEGRLGFELRRGAAVQRQHRPRPREPHHRRSDCCAAGSAARGPAQQRAARSAARSAGLFSAAHPLTDEEAADQWALICAGGGRTLGHRLIHYLDERERLADRWHGAIRDWPGRLSFTWGLRDPVADDGGPRRAGRAPPAAPVERLPSSATTRSSRTPRRSRPSSGGRR